MYNGLFDVDERYIQSYLSTKTTTSVENRMRTMFPRSKPTTIRLRALHSTRSKTHHGSFPLAYYLSEHIT